MRRWLNVLAVIATIAFNGLANALPLNGLTTGEISDRFEVYFVPAGYVFAIWGVIYLGLIVYAIFQVLPSQQDNPRLRRTDILFLMSCLANIAWLCCWHYEFFLLSVVVMLALLLLLVAIYLRLGVGRVSVPALEKWFVQVPFSIYLGWITVATIANVTSFLYYIQWDGLGIDPAMWAAIMLVAATIIATAVSLTRGDVAYMLVIAWAFAGIAIKHSGTQLVATVAWVMTAVVVIMLVVGFFVNRQRRRPPASAK